MIFDTHAHYDDERYDGDRETLLQTMRQEGVSLLVDIGADITSTKQAIALSEQYDFIYAAAGVHPSETAELTESDMEWLTAQAARPKVVAIGEIGLDYHEEEPPRETQKHWFVRQLAVARQTGLPVCIHSRDAAQDTLAILRQEKAEEIGGVIHCFSYGWDMARIYLDMGFYLGIGGVVTFKNAKKLKEVAAKMPLDRLVLETDAPYLTPEPFRGKRNASHYIKYVAEEIARLRQVEPETVLQTAFENGKRLYRMA